jgi:hypothetical protein
MECHFDHFSLPVLLLLLLSLVSFPHDSTIMASVVTEGNNDDDDALVVLCSFPLCFGILLPLEASFRLSHPMMRDHDCSHHIHSFLVRQDMNIPTPNVILSFLPGH